MRSKSFIQLLIYHTEHSLKYLRFKILCADLIIGPDISSLCLVSESMFKLHVE